MKKLLILILFIFISFSQTYSDTTSVDLTKVIYKNQKINIETSDDIDMIIKLMEDIRHDGKNDYAIEILKELIKKRPHKRFYIRLARLQFYSSGGFERSIEIRNKIKELDLIQTVDDMKEIVDVYCCAGERDIAIKFLEKILKKYPDETEFRYFYADCLLRKSRFDEAEEQFKKLIDMKIEDRLLKARIFHGFGLLNLIKKDYKTAIKYLKKTLKLDKLNGDVRLSLGAAYIADGNLKKAKLQKKLLRKYIIKKAVLGGGINAAEKDGDLEKMRQDIGKFFKIEMP